MAATHISLKIAYSLVFLVQGTSRGPTGIPLQSGAGDVLKHFERVCVQVGSLKEQANMY